MSWDIGTPNTATALAAMSPGSVRQLWKKTVDLFEQTEDYFMQFEGTNMDSPVHVINDTEADKGLLFNVTSRAGYFNRGKSGDSLFTSSSDFAIDVINNNQLQADYLRNATSATKRTDEFMGMQGELVNGQAVELGKWMGREKSSRLGMLLRLGGLSRNFVLGGGKSSQDSLLSSDGLTYNDILLMGQALKPMGGKPAEIGTVRGNPVHKYIVSGTTPSLFSLKQDPVYQAFLENAGPRENYDANPLWQGGYMEVDGHIIKEHNPIDNDGYAWAGSWFNPKAYTGTAITAGTSTFAVTGGGSAAAAAITNIDYFRFFENFAFEWTPESIYSPSNAVAYFLIINPRGAVTADNPDPGSVGMYSYTSGNNGNQITIVNRLAAVTAGAAVTTLGSVTWNTGVWSGRHSATHPIGSAVVQCNAKGVPIGDTVMLGAMAILRGYGMHRNLRTQWNVDGEFETRKYITTVFGQSLRKNVNGQYPGYIRIRTALSYPELGLPVVTS
jgi:hypothetical protein